MSSLNLLLTPVYKEEGSKQWNPSGTRAGIYQK